MALISSVSKVSISAVQVTGTSTVYTVPAGKTAKVRLVKVENWPSGGVLIIGNFKAINGTGATTDSNSNSRGSTSTNDNTEARPTLGLVLCSNGSNMRAYYMFIKEDHILVAGETVSQNSAAATFAYTIFEEDA